MRRRDLVLLAGAAIASPRAGRAQQTERVRRIGYLTPATGSPENIFGVLQTRALVEGLRELGWFDGRNIAIEHRFSGDGRERTRANAKELVALNPDVIMSVGGPVLAALLAETRTIPIVFSNVNDPVGSGFVASLARPGGNATGVAVSEAPIAGKWLELLKEVAPQLGRVMVLMEADARPQQLLADTVAAAASSLGLKIVTGSVREVADYDREIEAFAPEPGGGLQLSDLCPDRRPAFLWRRQFRAVSRCRPLYRSDPTGREAGRSAGAAADAFRAGRQPEDREGAGPHRPAIDPGPRRRGHRMR